MTNLLTQSLAATLVSPPIPTLPAPKPEPTKIGLRDGILRIDNTGLTMYKACPTRGQFYLKHKRERNSTTGALNAGSAIHLALERRYKHDTFSLDVAAEMIVELVNWYASHPAPDEDWRTLSRMHHVIEAYNKAYPSEPFKVLCVERPFEVELGTIDDIKVVWCGRIDLVIELGKEILIADHKTMQDFGSRVGDEYTNNGQCMGYAYAVQALGIAPLVHGFMLNAIVARKPLVRAAKEGGLPREEFHRQVFFYSQDRIQEWKENTLEICRRLLLDWKADNFPMFDNACVGKYGPCPYLPVCSLPPAQRSTMLFSDVYRDVTWTPLGERE